MISYYECDFANGYGMCIKAKRELTIKEANEFYKEDAENNGGICNITLSSREECLSFYDFSNEENWKIFE